MDTTEQGCWIVPSMRTAPFHVLKIMLSRRISLKNKQKRYSKTSIFTLDNTVAPTSHQILPSGYWWSLLYGTGILLLCLLVCLVGAHIYAKATFLIFLIVMVVLVTILVSFFAVRPKTILLPSPNNGTANFTGFKLETLLGNLNGK